MCFVCLIKKNLGISTIYVYLRLKRSKHLKTDQYHSKITSGEMLVIQKGKRLQTMMKQGGSTSNYYYDYYKEIVRSICIYSYLENNKHEHNEVRHFFILRKNNNIINKWYVCLNWIKHYFILETNTLIKVSYDTNIQIILSKLNKRMFNLLGYWWYLRRSYLFAI